MTRTATTFLAGMITAFAIALALTATANAQGPTEEAKLAASLPIAEAAFVQTDCAGHANIILRADDQLASLAAYWQMTARGFAGYALPASWTYAPDWPWRNEPLCTVYLKSGMAPVEFCTVLTHEAGHLAGHQHDDADALMNGRGELFYEPCVTGVAALTAIAAPTKPEAITPAAERPLTLAEELHGRVSRMLPRAYTWTVTCRPLRSTDQRRLRVWGTCNATAPRARARRYVADQRGETLYREDQRQHRGKFDSGRTHR
jgi:hypothetical protein